MHIMKLLVAAMVFVFGLPFGMAALTADRQTTAKDASMKSFPVKASTKIYQGALVMLDTTGGYVLPAADAANSRVVGVADQFVDNSAGASGDKNIRVITDRAFLFDATAITQAMLGQVMYVVDDHTFDDGTGTNGVPCGRLVEFISATSGYIYIPTGGLQAARIADGTYSANEQTAINDSLT